MPTLQVCIRKHIPQLIYLLYSKWLKFAILRHVVLKYSTEYLNLKEFFFQNSEKIYILCNHDNIQY